MNIINMITTKNKNHYNGVNKCLYITIHETGNTDVGANAINHAKYINNGSSETWHYTVDSERVVQQYNESVQCWHCGDGRGDGNLNSIGIEMCVNSDGNINKTIDNTIDLVKYLMNKFNIPINNVVQHNRWNGKNCPQNIRSGKPITWGTFIDKIKSTPIDKDVLYKVQVGAFSIKDNAIKLSNELQKLGYDNFIVTQNK